MRYSKPLSWLALIFVFLSAAATPSVAQLQHFIPSIDRTGSDATVFIPLSANPNINGTPLQSGDEIGVFSPEGLLVGSVVWTGVSSSITIWGDNSQTSAVDGLKVGDVFSFRVWDQSANAEYASVSVTYDAAYRTDGAYADRAIYSLKSISATNSNMAPLVINPIADQSGTIGGAVITIDLASQQVFHDPEGDVLTFRASTSNSQIATVTISGSILSLTPVGAGTATITISATDPSNAKAEDTFNISVIADSSNPPVASNDNGTTQEDQPVDINVLLNDSSPAGLDASSVSVVSSPINGTTTVQSGSIRYTPYANYHGNDGFSYTVKDVNGVTSNTARVSVIVNPVNDAPIAANPISDQQIQLNGRTSVDLNLKQLGTFSDVDDDVLTFEAQSESASIATVSINGDVLTVNAVYAGTTGVNVKARDPFGESATTRFNVTVKRTGGTRFSVSGQVVLGSSDEPIESASLSLNSNQDGSITTNIETDGTFNVEDIDEDDYNVVLSTQNEPDGITATDALLVGNSSAGKNQFSSHQFKAGDVNKDGQLDLEDAKFIAQVAIGRATSFPAGTYFLNQDKIEVKKDTSGVLLHTYAYGDIDESSSNIKKVKTSHSTTQQVNLKAKAGEPITIPVVLDQPAELGALTMQISFPGAIVRLESVTSSLDGLISNNKDDILRIAWFRTDSGAQIAIDDTLLTLEFVATGDIEHLNFDLSGEFADWNAVIIPVNPQISVLSRTDTETELGIPTEFALHGNYPNPFNPSTTLSFDLPESAEIQIQIFDLTGRLVQTLPAQNLPAGRNHRIGIDGSSLASGIYLYRVHAVTTSGHLNKTGQMVLVK